MATCSMRLSLGAQRTVVAGPQKDMALSIGLMRELRAPLRPWASWMVADENFASRLTASALGRSILVLTWIMVFSFSGLDQVRAWTALSMAAMDSSMMSRLVA